MFDSETLTGNVMPNLAALVLEHASAIHEIVSARHFRNPRVVDYDDPDYDVTLLLEPVGPVTLFDLGGVMNDIEDKLALKAFVVRTEISRKRCSFGTTGRRQARCRGANKGRR